MGENMVTTSESHRRGQERRRRKKGIKKWVPLALNLTQEEAQEIKQKIMDSLE